MASVYARGSKLWCRYKDEAGKWRSMSTGETDRAKAERFADRLQKKIDRERAADGATGPLTVRQYFARWIKEREELGVRNADHEASAMTRYVLRHLGHLRLDEVRPIHIRDMFRAIRATQIRRVTHDGKEITVALAPRTVLGIYGLVHRLFETAVSDELIEHNPCRLTHKRGRDLPKKRDHDPEWRSQATYTINEVERLISDTLIPVERRVLYALKSLAALRHGEAAALRWRHYDPSLEPLGRLVVAVAYDSRNCEEKSTKGEDTRRVPVHPTLAKILAAWKISHWERIYGRAPTADDLIVPTRALNNVNVSDAGHALTDDLGALGLRVAAGARRVRGGHDLRAWFITTCQEHGAHRDLLRLVTHGEGTDVQSGYTRATWPARCAQVAVLKCSILGGEVLELATEFATAEARARNRWGKVSEPRRSRNPYPLPELPPTIHGCSGGVERDGGSRITTVAGLATALAAAVLAGAHERARALAKEIATLAAEAPAPALKAVP